MTPAASASGLLSSPPTAAATASRRIPVTHLLNFEVANNEAVRFIGTSPSRKGLSGMGTKGSLVPFNKQRYIHASFRFVCLAGRVPEEYDTPVPWEDVEAVLVPYSPSQSPTCPVCLDSPIIAPRMTCCGHIFCWTCLMRFVAETLRPISASPGSGNKWRKCPICFEPMHEKQLRSVIFQPNVQEIVENDKPTEYDFLLLSKKVGERDPVPFDCNQNDSDGSLANVFSKVTAVSPQWIKENIIAREQAELCTLLEDDYAGPHAQVALTLCEDRKLFLEKALFQENIRASPKKDDAPTLYFHQSVDGQYIFLLPFCIKILKAHFSAYPNFPARLKAPVLELEWHAMTFENRKRFKQLAHLPLGTQFALAEIDLSKIVPAHILRNFKPELQARKEQRDSRLAQKNAPRKASLSYSAVSDFFPSVDDDFVEDEPQSDLTDLQQFPALFAKSPSADQIPTPVWKPAHEPAPGRKKYTISGGSMHYQRKR